MQGAVAFIAQHLKVAGARVAPAVALLQEQCTVPFIARYRRDRTDLSEEELHRCSVLLERFRTLDAARGRMLETLRASGRLTAQLEAAFGAVTTQAELDELWAPFKSKRETHADVARARGLEPLARLLLDGADQRAFSAALARFSSRPDAPCTRADAEQGVRHLLHDDLVHTAEVRTSLQALYLSQARLSSKLIKKRAAAGAEAAGKEPGMDADRFALYHDFERPVRAVQAHQVLAINRGEKAKLLRVGVTPPHWAVVERAILKRWPPKPGVMGRRFWASVVEEAWAARLQASLGRFTRSHLTGMAHESSIETFERNLEALLLQRPLRGVRVLGIDPGLANGCKVAAVDEHGQPLEVGRFRVKRGGAAKASPLVTDLCRRHEIHLIAIGNGTASRDAELVVAESIREAQLDAKYTFVSEAGASVYSVSPLAQAELAEYDALDRGAVSLARRVQDPMSELIKVDTQALGIGLYQHDIKKSELAGALKGVVERAVSNVGVNPNSASSALLQRVSGLSSKVAENLIAHRVKEGPFLSRSGLKGVKGLGPKAFEQAAGFLVIDGDEPLDRTGVHPTDYRLARKVIQKLGDDRAALEKAASSPGELAQALDAAPETVSQICASLARPGLDPRDAMPEPLFRSNARSVDELQVGETARGRVENVVAFGAFVDIGVGLSGLLHASKMGDAALAVGAEIDVVVLEVDPARRRISLALKGGSRG